MKSNEYHFITTWDVEATIEEVSDILADAESLVRWWPSVYLEVETLKVGDENDIGKIVSLYTKGWLPYTLRWQFEVTENRRPHGFTLNATGDFNGRGIWTLEQRGPIARVIYDWKLVADKPLLRRMSFLMKPIFSANHHWAMRKGLESLKLELMRNRTQTEEERSRIPQPEGPSFRWLLGGRQK